MITRNNIAKKSDKNKYKYVYANNWINVLVSTSQLTEHWMRRENVHTWWVGRCLEGGNVVWLDSDHECWTDKILENGGHGLISKYYPRICFEESHEKSMKTTNNPAKIWTGNFSNSSTGCQNEWLVHVMILLLLKSQDSSVSILISYRLDNWNSIPDGDELDEPSLYQHTLILQDPFYYHPLSSILISLSGLFLSSFQTTIVYTFLTR